MNLFVIVYYVHNGISAATYLKIENKAKLVLMVCQFEKMSDVKKFLIKKYVPIYHFWANMYA